MKQLFNIIRKILDTLWQSNACRSVLLFMRGIGLWYVVKNYIFLRSFAKRNMRNPTPGMIENRKFFDTNKHRVGKIVSYLSDDESKQMYLDMIDFMCSSDIDKVKKGSIRSQYFPPGIFTLKNDEVFIDCGAYDGDTIRKFKKMSGKFGGFSKIVAFEPDDRLYKLLENKHKDCVLLHCGVWSEDAALTFSNDKMMYHSTGDKQHADILELPVKAIDNCPECEDATFIKMDIEGAELPALKGAEKLIVRNKPKLAICIYHSREDMLDIAEWIHEKVPEYKLYVRQHMRYSIGDTVLYAAV